MNRLPTILILASILISLSFANIIRVPQDQPTIQAGIDFALASDTVLVEENTYYENINFKGKAITVASAFIMDSDTSHISRTIINGSLPSTPDSGSVVYFISGEDSTSVLCGLTITAGTGTYNEASNYIIGGGIFMKDSGGKIVYNIISENTIDAERGVSGGGIINFGELLLNRNVIIDNNIIRYNVIISEWSSYGGGIRLNTTSWDGVYCRINNNHISHNSATNDHDRRWVHGGGISIALSLPTLNEILISNNVITYNEIHGDYCYGGAGIGIGYSEPGGRFNDYNPCPLIFNNIIAHNYSEDYGAAIRISTGEHFHDPNSIIYPQPAIINNTIVNNKSKDGCAIMNYNSYPLLLNNIIWNDLSAPGSREIFNDDSPFPWLGNRPNNGKIYMFNSIIQDRNWSSIESGCFYFSPLLFSETHQLSRQSSAIGLGRKTLNIDGSLYEAPLIDKNGNPRPNPIDTLIDIGALESPYQKVLNAIPKSLYIDKVYMDPESDSIQFTSQISNPAQHDLNVFARITSTDDPMIYLIDLFDDGNHADGQENDGFYGGVLGPVKVENEFLLSLGIKDNAMGNYFIFKDNKRFTSVGPLIFEGYEIFFNLLSTLGITITLRNMGQMATAEAISIELSTTDTVHVTEITTGVPKGTELAAGQTVELEQSFYLRLSGSPDKVPCDLKIFSNGRHFWSDSFSLDLSATAIRKDEVLPKNYSLAQNYPNPFNPKTVISYQLPVTSHTDLSIYNSLGQKVTTLVSDIQQAGFHSVEWDASNVVSGVYYYRLEAGNSGKNSGPAFVSTKKLIVIK